MVRGRGRLRFAIRCYRVMPIPRFAKWPIWGGFTCGWPQDSLRNWSSD